MLTPRYSSYIMFSSNTTTALLYQVISWYLSYLCSNFTSGDVVLAEKSPLYFNGDIKFTFTVSIDGKELAGGNDDTMYVIPKATIEGTLMYLFTIPTRV